MNSHVGKMNRSNEGVKFGCCLGFGASFMPQADSGAAQSEQAARRPGEAGSEARQLLDDLRKAMEFGYDFPELTVGALMHLTEAEFAETAQLLQDAGITVPVFNSFIPPTLKLTGPVVEAAAIETFVTQAMERVRAVGGSQIIFGSGGARTVPDGFSHEEAMGQIKQFLRICDKHAGRFGLIVAIEPLNRRESNIINKVGEALDLATELNLPNIKVLADGYHMHLEREPFAVLSKATAAGLLTHVHLAEYDRSYPAAGGAGPAGVDYVDFFAELRKSGYEGGVSLECNAADFTAKASAALRFIKSVWIEA
jgi:sugar phosphate isomerase/epimerase